MTSPAVVGGRAYVIDQMGTAYCIDARTGRIVWKTSPDAAGAMGADGVLAMTRLSLRDGQVVKDGKLDSEPWSTPAVRGAVVAGRDHEVRYYGKNAIALHDFETGKTLVRWRDDKDATPMVTSHALAKEHLVATTLRGEVLVIDLPAKPGTPPFRFRTPKGRVFWTSAASGMIYCWEPAPPGAGTTLRIRRNGSGPDKWTSLPTNVG